MQQYMSPQAIALLVFVLAALLPAAAPAQEREAQSGSEVELSLSEAVEQALAQNLTISLAERQVRIAQERVAQANALSRPEVTFNAAAQTRDSEPKQEIGGIETPVGDQETSSAQLGVQMPLLDFGRASNQQEAARYQVDVSRRDAEQTRDQLANAVGQAYYGVLEAQRQIGVVRSGIQVVERQLAQAEAFFEQGLVAPTEVLAIRVRLAERQQNLIRAEVGLDRAISSFNRLLGRALDAPARLQDVSEPAGWDKHMRDLTQQALEQRADLASAQRQLDAAQAQLRAVAAVGRPRLDAFFDVLYSSESGLVEQTWSQVGVRLNVPLYRGGADSAAYREAQLAVLQARDAVRIVEDDIRDEVRQAYLQVREAADQIPVARANVELALENLRAEEERFSQGLTASTAVLEREDDLSRARSGHAQALYAYYRAQAQLGLATGSIRNMPPFKEKR